MRRRSTGDDAHTGRCLEEFSTRVVSGAFPTHRSRLCDVVWNERHFFARFWSHHWRNVYGRSLAERPGSFEWAAVDRARPHRIEHIFPNLGNFSSRLWHWECAHLIGVWVNYENAARPGQVLGP